ncbi:MAG TPA: 3'-5' exonuclease, partial [Chloroflexota bacterium]
LRLAHNPYDTVSLNRVINVPPRGIGTKTLAELERWAAKRGLSLGEAALHLADEGSASGDLPLGGRGRSALTGFGSLLRDLVAAKAEATVLELLDLALDRSGYARYVQDGSEEGEDRWRNIMELRTKARDYEQLRGPEALASFLEEVSLVQEVDGLDGEGDAVTLITLHQAKGLEFPYVFIVGFEEGLCPHARSLDDAAQMEEERRLCYVGITRAMRGLYLVYARYRTLYGNPTTCNPSRFLDDLPRELVVRGPVWQSGEEWTRRLVESPRAARWGGALDARAGSDASSVARTGTADAVPGRSSGRVSEPERSEQPAVSNTEGSERHDFQPGDRVWHAAFGRGTVQSRAEVGGDVELVVHFDERGVRRLSLSFAPLKPL